MHKLSFVLMLFFLFSCAHPDNLMKGTITKKLDESSGIALFENNEVKVGEVLHYLNSTCDDKLESQRRGTCHLMDAGELKIKKILNDNFVQFEVVHGDGFREGSIISVIK